MNLKTIREAAVALDVNESLVRRAVRCGQLSCMALGNRKLVDVDEAREVLAKPQGVTIDEVSAQTGLTASAIRRGIREGWMPCARLGKRYYFEPEAVRAAIASRMKRQIGGR